MLDKGKTRGGRGSVKGIQKVWCASCSVYRVCLLCLEPRGDAADCPATDGGGFFAQAFSSPSFGRDSLQVEE